MTRSDSLGNLEAYIADALNSDATPQEVYDAIVNTTKEEIVYHKRCLQRSENLLLLLKGNLSALYNKSTPEDVWNRHD